jgi:hypothetical protein
VVFNIIIWMEIRNKIGTKGWDKIVMWRTVKRKAKRRIRGRLHQQKMRIGLFENVSFLKFFVSQFEFGFLVFFDLQYLKTWVCSYIPNDKNGSPLSFFSRHQCTYTYIYFSSTRILRAIVNVHLLKTWVKRYI